MFSYNEILNTRLKTFKTIYINVLNEWYSILMYIQHHYIITVNIIYTFLFYWVRAYKIYIKFFTFSPVTYYSNSEVEIKNLYSLDGTYLRTYIINFIHTIFYNINNY